jgi:hypothetical protein
MQHQRTRSHHASGARPDEHQRRRCETSPSSPKEPRSTPANGNAPSNPLSLWVPPRTSSNGRRYREEKKGCCGRGHPPRRRKPTPRHPDEDESLCQTRWTSVGSPVTILGEHAPPRVFYRAPRTDIPSARLAIRWFRNEFGQCTCGSCEGWWAPEWCVHRKLAECYTKHVNCPLAAQWEPA